MAKKRSIIIDFSHADPVAGSRRYDRIPEGTYVLDVKKAIEKQTATDKPAISITLVVSKGSLKGKTIGDLFVLPRKDTDDSIFGVQRLHGMYIASGGKRIKGKTTGAKIAKALIGSSVLAEVVDSSMPATGSYSERITSAPQTYYKIGSKEATEALKEAKERAAATEEEEEEEEEDFDEEEEDDDEDDEEDEEEDEDIEEEDEEEDDEEEEEEEEEEPPKKKAKKAKKPTKKSKKSKKAVEEDEDEDEDIYDDEDEDDDDDEDDDEDEDDD